MIKKSDDEDVEFTYILQYDAATKGKQWKDVKADIEQKANGYQCCVTGLEYGTKYMFRWE